MKRNLDEHAARFDEKSGEYDENRPSVIGTAGDLVVEHATAALAEGDAGDSDTHDVVLDLGTGTGAIALALAPHADRVVGRDISAGMLAQAREKAASGDFDNVTFDEGSFREPNYDGPADVVVSNFAMHHLDDAGKREAIEVIAGYEPRRFVLGDVMLFAGADPETPTYDPEVDDPSTVGHLADALTDAGFALVAVERVHDQVGVLVADRVDSGGGSDGSSDP